VGDFFTWGYGVNDDQTLAARLEQLLEGVKVINLGVTAYGLEQEYRYLQSEGLSYNPDLVIINICANDIEDYHPKRDLGSGFPLPSRKAPNSSDPNSSLLLKTKKFLGE
jgi:lysophospholipase L1-like esterase